MILRVAIRLASTIVLAQVPGGVIDDMVTGPTGIPTDDAGGEVGGRIECADGCESLTIELGPATVAVNNPRGEGCLTNRIGAILPDGTVVTDFIPYCPTGAAGGYEPAPPPTHAEVVAAVCPPVPTPRIGRDPVYEGVTGLDTYLWATAHEPLTASGTIRGYSVTCTLTPTEYRFSTGDGGDYRSATPGGPHPQQAATHLYEVRGDYTLALQVRWQRTTSAGADAPVATTAEPYHVYEVRPVPAQAAG